MRCGLRSPSCLASLPACRLGRVDGIAEQEAEGTLVLLVLGQIGHRRAQGPRAILDPLAEFAVGHDVELVVEDPPQHPLADLFLRAVEVKEVAALLAALVGLGIAGIGERRRSGLAGFGDVRLHRSRAEGRADDAVGLELATHAFDHVHHRALGSSVEGGTRMRHEPRHRGRVDDVPALAVSHDARQEDDDAVDGAAEVDPEHPVPVGEGRELGGPYDPDAGVVTEDVDLAETRFGSVCGAGVGRAVGHVEFQGQHALGRTELGRRGREMVLANVRDDDIHPGAEQGLGNAEPDAACAPRYECGFAWQVLHAAVLHESSAAVRRRGRTKRWTNRRKSYCRSEEHTSELPSPCNLVCRLLLEKKKKKLIYIINSGKTSTYTYD